jgi:hypothetical protein
MELIFAQSWSKWNWYLLKIEGKSRKNLVKVRDKRWSKLPKVMKWFAILTILKLLSCLLWKNCKPCLPWSKNFEYAYVSPDNFFYYAYASPENSFHPPPPLRRQHFWEKFVRLDQNPRKCDDTPSRRPWKKFNLSHLKWELEIVLRTFM